MCVMQPALYEGEVCCLNGICPVASALQSPAPLTNRTADKLL